MTHGSGVWRSILESDSLPSSPSSARRSSSDSGCSVSSWSSPDALHPNGLAEEFACDLSLEEEKAAEDLRRGRGVLARMVFRSGLSGLLIWPTALVCLLVGICLTSDTFRILVCIVLSGDDTSCEGRRGFAMLDVLARGRGPPEIARASATANSTPSIVQRLRTVN